MPKDLFWTFGTFGIIIGILTLTFWPADKNYILVKYDCHIAEISPDYPVAVKEQCRNLRSRK
jgi:hypothetical protein